MCGGGQNQPFGQSTGNSQPFGQMPRTGGMNTYMPKPGQTGGTFPQKPGTPGFPMLPGGGVEYFPQKPGTPGFPTLPGNGQPEVFPQRPGAQTAGLNAPQFNPMTLGNLPQTGGINRFQQRNADPFAAERARLGMGAYAGAAYGGPQAAKNHGGVGPAPPPPGPTQPPPQPGGGQPPWQSPENTYLAGPTAGFLGMSSGPPPDPRMMWHQQSGQYQLVPGWNGYNPTGR